MSHVLGLQLTREAPPLLGPLLSPFPLPLVPGAGRCCAAIADSPSPVCRGKGRLGGSSPHRRCWGETWGIPLSAGCNLGEGAPGALASQSGREA